jgi:hypothetical protein
MKFGARAPIGLHHVVERNEGETVPGSGIGRAADGDHGAAAGELRDVAEIDLAAIEPKQAGSDCFGLHGVAFVATEPAGAKV